MKKGVFSVMHYYMPKLHNVLTLHSSANQGKDGDGKKFFFFNSTNFHMFSNFIHILISQ